MLEWFVEVEEWVVFLLLELLKLLKLLLQFLQLRLLLTPDYKIHWLVNNN